MLPERPAAFDPEFLRKPASASQEVGPQATEPVHVQQICPNCSYKLMGHHCKLVCNQCGYYLSCSDYY